MRAVGLVIVSALIGSLAGGASAADLKKAPALRELPTATWSGLYVGGHLGYAQSRITFGDPATPGVTATDTLKGFLGGGQIGYNYQMGTWVLGAEADFSASNADATQTVGTDRATEKLLWTSLLTARLGYTFDRAMIYAKAGAAFGGFQVDATDLATGGFARTRYSQAGWTAGAGVEYALTNTWSVRGGYDYLSFANKTISLTDSAGTTTQLSIKQNIHQFKSSLNYRF